MASLRELSANPPVVVLDAASPTVQVGIIEAEASVRWCSRTEEAGVAVFQCVHELRIVPTDVKTWVYCHGPGSVLGVRTVAMALRTWGVLRPAPVFSYTSLAVVAHALDQPSSAVITDARRETWHHYTMATGLQRVARSDLSGSLVMPEGFRHWSHLPVGVKTVPYVLADLLPRVWDVDLLRPSVAPDAFLHEEPSYVTWTPQIHRAPAH
jgi:tRNA threonylcarbamoyladenosine biosynthesis protein TsaB